MADIILRVIVVVEGSRSKPATLNKPPGLTLWYRERGIDRREVDFDCFDERHCCADIETESDGIVILQPGDIINPA